MLEKYQYESKEPQINSYKIIESPDENEIEKEIEIISYDDWIESFLIDNSAVEVFQHIKTVLFSSSGAFG
jgi:uncharacterized protein YqkB